MKVLSLDGYILSDEYDEDQIEDMFFEFLDRYNMQFIGIIDRNDEEEE